MAYITPTTNRTALDIANRTSKGFWNVADWERVYNNSQLVNSLVAVTLGAKITFDVLTAPTIATIPTVEDFNTFLANIERTRLEFINAEPVTPGTTTEIKDDYEAGAQGTAPNYIDANLWESTLDAIWEYYDGPDLEVCPTLSNDLTILSTDVIYVDCIDTANFNIDLQGSANLFII